MIFEISEGSVCCDHLTIFKKCTKHICSGNMSPGAAMLCALPTLSEHEHASKPAEQQQLSCVFFFVVWGLSTGSVPTRVPTPGFPSQANAYARGSLC